jgi:hypothetical protein
VWGLSAVAGEDSAKKIKKFIAVQERKVKRSKEHDISMDLIDNISNLRSSNYSMKKSIDGRSKSVVPEIKYHNGRRMPVDLQKSFIKEWKPVEEDYDDGSAALRN